MIIKEAKIMSFLCFSQSDLVNEINKVINTLSIIDIQYNTVFSIISQEMHYMAYIHYVDYK